ncbi:maternal effect embryo arrest 14 [Arabidopsis thaliana]|uniref:Isoform 2 of CCG-binding protein 1 n=1 Tax=Arabidopsis thaliana TaxID=3702 RepID=Q9XIM0-2|nr:maternal effect embryo arrest 14 [Arabidopsis thaliana]AEC06445.1 maternal effect embryo arrest 14 [Arabidopsis thaliana]|eukprot:NP_001077895.1 maternal effect embryo arrest 14 [Arabidopsis thaliana]
MIKSVTLRSFHLPIEFNDTKFVSRPCFLARSFPVVRCSSTRDVPKLELFSRGKFDRILQDPPLIEKAESELSDYCSTLEGDDSYSCWRAYFELKDLEREKPKVEVENLILQTGEESDREKGMNLHIHIPDGLPKSEQELEEEEKSKMPDSAFTRLLRSKGTIPAWFSHAPDHETD